MNRRGLTLLELLAALALLGLIAVATAGWLRVAGRGAHAAGEQTRGWSREAAALRLLRDDLRLGTPATLDEDGARLSTVSLHGIDAAGRHELHWLVADDQLRRATGEEEGRRVLIGLPPHRFHRDEAGDLWWLLGIEPGAEPETADRRHLVWAASW